MDWVKLHTKLLESRVFANEGLLKVWVYCLCRANRSKAFVPIATGRGHTDVELHPGQFIFGRNEAAKTLNMKPSTVWKRMRKLKSMENIDIKSNSHYSIVSVCNWDVYQYIPNKKEQAKEQPSNNQVTGKEQPSNTDKSNESNKNNNGTTPAYADGDIPYELSKFLLGKITEYKPNHRFTKKPPDLQKWSEEAERMNRIDGRDLREAGRVVQWVFDKHLSNGSFDWRDNIQSIEKLRKHYDKLESQSKTKKGVTDEFIDSLYK